MKKNHFISGEWNVICDVCSKKIKAHDAKQRWDGFIVCPDDFEHRHPQDFVKAKTDKITVPFTRPRPVDIFVDDGNRFLTDIITIVDNLDFYIKKPLSDMIGLDDVGQDYIETSYFAEEYIESSGLMIKVKKPFAETIVVNETGSLFHNSYIEASYFAEDYVGTLTSF